MFIWQCCFHLIIVFISKGFSHTVTLQPLYAEVVENGNISLTCYSPDIAGIQTFSSWNYSKNNVLPVVEKANDSCTATGFIRDNPDLYAWSCPEDNKFVLTLKHVNRFDHHNTWMCTILFLSSNEVTVSVKVPVKTATITSHTDGQVSTMENAHKKLKCRTSQSRPIPALSWFLSDPDMKKTINITDASRQSPQAGDSDDLTEVESVLNYTFSRDDNGWHVYCQASNTPGRRVNSSTKVLFIIFPPAGPILTNRNDGDVYRVIEYQQGNLSCLVKGGNPPANLTWQCFGGQVTLPKRNGSVISNITWRVLRYQHNKSCTCVSEHISGKLNVSVNVKVLYPPYKPKFSIKTFNVNRGIEIIQNNSLTVICTSESNPSPDYVWIKQSDVIGYGQTLIIDRTKVGDTGEYECRVNNTMFGSDGLTKDGRNSSNITLKILFPPNPPQLKYINDTKEHVITSSMINVIRGDRFTISCQSDGQPRPDYRWENGSVGNTTDIIATESMNKTCTATNIMRETVGEERPASTSVALSVNVLYKPTMPRIYISNKTGDNHTVSEYIQILEDDSFYLLCTSDGRPYPLFTWYLRNGETLTHNKLVIMNINRQQSGQYHCQASNTMLRTFGEEESGSSEINTTIDVLYPAEVDILANTTVIEGDFINITCPVILGNTPVTTVKWTPAGELGDMNSSVLYISNISRTDEKLYICSVTTIMKPTYGLATKKENFRHFNLTVNYKARVTNFYIGEKTHEDAYIVNETDNVTFRCDIDSKPAPNATIFVNDRVVFLSKDNNVLYTKNNIQCSDFGFYRCSSINDYNNGRPSARNFTLYINCSPRRSPFIELKTNVTSARNTAVTFSFTALAYPEPGPAGFNWSFINGSEAVPFSNSSNVLVSSSKLQSNLTIRKVTYHNYGRYILTIRNTAGIFEQNFFLQQNELMQNVTELKSSSDTTVAVAGAMSGVVVIIALLVIGGLLYRKRRHANDTGKLLYANIPFTGNAKNKKDKCEKSKVNETPFEGLQDIDDVPMVTREPVEYYNSQDILETIDRIKVSELFSYLTGKDEDSFGIDYQKLPTGLEKPCTFARKPEHLAKNRYNGIYPYDHSRVKLLGDPDYFINACYIDGYKRTKAYIASLGPTAKTTSDFKMFWQMIWHGQSDIIVMLTNLREPSGMKCEKYWPDHEDSECYGDINVTGQNIEIFAEYTVRIFSILKDDESRTVTHLHYTAWPDKKVPEDTISLLEFRQRLKITPTGSKGPVVVHCSAGIGRTGTLIALDRLIEEGQSEGSVNVYECVLSMREQRVKMVQTLEQYIYIYKALVSALVFDSETIPLENYEEYMDTASNTTFSYQFKQLQQLVDTDNKEEKESRKVNASRTTKNRSEADIPAGHCRVFLYFNRESDDSDYINAVYMNSFKRKEYFIVAQSPLTNTVADFICMLYQEDCTCIVTMEDLKEPGMSVGVYLPSDGHTLKFGQFIVSCTRLEMSHHCIVRKVIIKLNGKNENGEKTLYHFQYTNWMSANDCPLNASEFVQFVTEVEEYANQFCEERSHVLVHCLNANERSGLFCAVTTLIEKLKYERQVNVMNTLRHIRTRRKTSITSMEQLKFCYQAGSVYIKVFRP